MLQCAGFEKLTDRLPRLEEYKPLYIDIITSKRKEWVEAAKGLAVGGTQDFLAGRRGIPRDEMSTGAGPRTPQVGHGEMKKQSKYYLLLTFDKTIL